MKILSIETSCDETAVSIVEASGGLESPSFNILGNALFSQIEIHKEYGGVFPTLAKREHAKNLPPLLVGALKQAQMYEKNENIINDETKDKIKKILIKENGLFENFLNEFEKINKPHIDLITVTQGPGLEPALWVGISFAEALGELWEIPVIPANHMEGHIASILVENNAPVVFPALALLISGGHTEIVSIESWGKYEIVGETVDDAVGEAFDKTARLLGLPYPGGPEISKLAEEARSKNLPHTAVFPRPMIHSNNLNFSFSGLKTAVLYYIRDNYKGNGENMPQNDKADIAREFEDSVIEVLTTKVKKILEEKDVKTLIIAGGVISNKEIKKSFEKLKNKYSDLSLKTPTKELATDNSVMIACATYIKSLVYPEILTENKKIIANGNLKLK